MEMSLQNLLEASLHPDGTIRSQAEEALSTRVSAVQLVEFIKSAPASREALRLAALVYLKNDILHRWTNQFAEFRGPVCPGDEKHALRHACFHLIGDTTRTVRLQAGYIVSKMITADYPEEWATVLDDLMAILAKPQSASWLHGSLVVMKGMHTPPAKNESGYGLTKDRFRGGQYE